MSDNNFYSIDKLVEFGMGITIANQMASSMNQSLNQMEIPGAGKAMPSSIETVYYAVMNDTQMGPYSITELSRLITDKKIVKETYVWKPGMKQWDLVENIPEVLRLIALTPPPIPNP
ncbi:DUF4339 domain-containing protein [Hespellia stercorisuis]|uniref:GYF domain-containing protein n=1 Tax=Hespellia stercorisuis DSM 15480 TaxID=1121950 RepID=A0A1M6UBX1_9FIRM|nr:DUF4339 domain-containing protein [Hespellia stercorisuis]SHK66745.1 protein of unknown function [Hespellia stercorisuis DSM 15480]